MNDQAKEELTPRDVTIMEDILKKGKFGITPAERAMLVARRGYLTDETLAQYDIEGPEVKEEEKVKDGENGNANPKYQDLKHAELKAEAKERGIILEKTAKSIDIIALLEQFDALKDGDEFQGKIAKTATQEIIDENELGEEVKVGDLVFIDKE